MMAALGQATLDIRTQDQLSIARRTVQEWATAIGLGTLERTKFVTAASEIGRNTLVHGGGGQMIIEEVSNESNQRGLRLIFSDEGPGIADIAQALTDGYTTGKSMGLGFGGAKRLVSEFDVRSSPGSGTTVTLTQWKRR